MMEAKNDDRREQEVETYGDEKRVTKSWVGSDKREKDQRSDLTIVWHMGVQERK